MVVPRQVIYDINHFGFIYYTLKNIINKSSKNKRQYSKFYKLFQDKFFDISGIEDVIPLSRARFGIYLYLKKIISKEKNQVLLSPFTIFDVVNMVISAGGKPVFIDIKAKDDLNIKPDNIKKFINPKTCSIILTHYHTNNPYILEIRNICDEKKIKLIEDCAISLGSENKGKHVGFFSDASIYSFSLFKFISVYQGGAIYIKDKKVRDIVSKEINSYQIFSEKEMFGYFFKGLKFSLVMNKYIFKFVFRILRFGFNKNIKFIRDLVKNDPKPFIRTNLPKSFSRKANLYQLMEFTRQLNKLKLNQEIRKSNFLSYCVKLDQYKLTKHSNNDAYLNYPIILKNKSYKILFIKHMMNKYFDLGEYFYRSCNTESVFVKYAKSCPNSEHYSNCVVLLPTHINVGNSYINDLCKEIDAFMKIYPNSLC